MGLGAYYNYSTYGASGLDLIPYVAPLSTYLHTVCIPQSAQASPNEP